MKTIAFARTLGLAVALAVSAAGQAADDADDAAAEETADAELAAAQAELRAAQQKIRAAARKMAEAARDSIHSIRLQPDDRAFLGILLGPQTKDGIHVVGVTPGGGAESAGIVDDDILVAVGGESLTGHDEPLEVLHRVLEGVAPGGNVEVLVARDGETHTFDVVTATSAADLAFDWPHAIVRPMERAIRSARPLALDFLSTHGGLHLVDIGEDLGGYFGVDGGVLVVNVPGKSELKPGDIVRRIDGADVASAVEAHRLLGGTTDAEVEVRRRNRSVSVTVPGQGGALRTLVAPHGNATVIYRSPEVEVEVEAEKEAR